MANDIIARYENVTKSYDGTTVVHDLNLDVRRGEFLSLLGPSGSGKTTTLMMLAGLQSPSTGHIMLDGVRIEGIPPHRRNIGLVFQNYALFPHMTIAENLAYPLKARRMARTEIARKVERGLDMVKLSQLARRYPSELSGGQQQRVALARALVFEPSIVLLDEPLGALDRQLRETMQLELMQLHRETAVTMVYVTHDQGEAMTMSDRVAVFNEGRLLQCAPPRQLYDAPETPFVAEFVGENNRLTGTVAKADPVGLTVRTDGGMEFTASARGGIRTGDRVSAYLRPERLRVGRDASSCDNVLPARVRDRIFLGDHTRMRLELPDRSIVTAKVGSPQEADVPFDETQVAVGWATPAAQLLRV